MTVYVDDMLRPAKVRRTTSRWSHLMADDHDELLAFARRLGLRPEWIQSAGTYREHFDLTEQRRAKALELGAEAITYPSGTALILARKRRKDPTMRLAGRFSALMAEIQDHDADTTEETR